MKKIHFAALAMSTAVAASSFAYAADTIVEGKVTEVFGQRYVVTGASGKMLVDVGPKGNETVKIAEGDVVKIDGEMTDAGEFHAMKVSVNGGEAKQLDNRGVWAKMTGKDMETPFSPVEAKKEVEDKGYVALSDAMPDKKHFAFAASKDGKFYEVHAHRNGDVKQIRAIDSSDKKFGTFVK